MNPQSPRKPFFILNPLSVINQEAVIKSMLDNLIKEYSDGGSISSQKFESAHNASFANGIFDYAKFKSLIRADFKLFPDTVINKALKGAMETQMHFGFDKHTIRTLRDQGNVSFLLTKQTVPELDQLQKGIVQLIKKEFNSEIKEVREDDLFFQKKVKENTLTIVTQTDKKPPAQKLLEYADVVQEKGMGFSPKIVVTDINELVQLNQERIKQRKVGERVSQAGLEMFLIDPQRAQFTKTIPKEIWTVSSLKEILVPRATGEGARHVRPFV